MGEVKEAIILAGGLGTRLRSIVKDVPKPMAEVNGKPFLHYLFLYLKAYDYQSVILSVGYKSEVVSDFFGGKYMGMEIRYSHEKEPLGTGGGIKKALGWSSGNDLLVLNGDTFFDVDLNLLAEKHLLHNSHCTLALRQVQDPSRYGTVNIDGEGRIKGFTEKGESKGSSGFINGGVYLLNRKEFLKMDFPQKFSLEKDYFEKLYSSHPLYGFPFEGYFIDIGIPKDYHKAQDEFKGFKYR